MVKKNRLFLAFSLFLHTGWCNLFFYLDLEEQVRETTGVRWPPLPGAGVPAAPGFPHTGIIRVNTVPYVVLWK